MDKNDVVNSMKRNTSLYKELEVLTGTEGYKAVDGVFASHGFADASVKEKTSMLYHVMRIEGGGGSPTLTAENIYGLVKDLLTSRDWAKPSQGCSCSDSCTEEL